MRVASSFAAKPPNTTLCTAPMRAQASIAMTASGTIGHIEDDALALATPKSCNHCGERLHLGSNRP